VTEFLQALVDGVNLGSLYALLALGIALVFGVMGLVNFAHGELLMVSGYTFYVLGGPPLLVAVAIVLTVATATAVGMERVAFRPLRHQDPTTLLVCAFAVSYLLQSIATFAFGSRPKSINVVGSFNDSVGVAGLQVSKLEIVTFVVTAALLAGLAVFLRRTSAGVQMRAAAEDFPMASLLGVRGNRVIALAFGISGVFAGVAALLYLGQTGSLTPSVGLAPVLVAFVASVMGGMGTLYGAAVGGMLLGLLSVLLQTYLPEDLQPYRDAFVFTAVIAILLVRPNGLIAPRSLTARV
jgi:branched-chain amino acid transport system permease protein